VRQVAARALAPLVSTQHVDELLRTVCSLLPSNSDEPGKANVMHGLLVQARTVLDSHVHMLVTVDFGSKQQTSQQ